MFALASEASGKGYEYITESPWAHLGPLLLPLWLSGVQIRDVGNTGCQLERAFNAGVSE